LGALAVVEDVSQRHQLDAVRRDFIANVSHELRTPVGALQVLAETMAEEDSPSVLRRLAVRVGLEANRAGRLIADLLDLSRIEAEGLAEPTVVDLVVVVEKSVERVRESAQQRSITLAVDAGPARTRGNEAQLVSAVTNLLDNAVKYTERGGSVAASTARVDDHVVVRVADTGIGIPSRDLDRIFERFYRVDPGRSRETGGTGLGLAIVRHVARNHGGDVVVESTEGVGSSFTMKLLAHDAS
jgi:two-component system sensor histidine kinase SenX3